MGRGWAHWGKARGEYPPLTQDWTCGGGCCPPSRKKIQITCSSGTYFPTQEVVYNLAKWTRAGGGAPPSPWICHWYCTTKPQNFKRFFKNSKTTWQGYFFCCIGLLWVICTEPAKGYAKKITRGSKLVTRYDELLTRSHELLVNSH